MTEERFNKAQHAVWIGITCNLVLALIKGVVGVAAGSKALIADALHSASAAGCSLAAWIGLKDGQRPSLAEEHPNDHGKMQAIASIIVSVLLLFVGVEIVFAAIKALAGQEPRTPKAFAFIAIVLSMLIKEAIFQYKVRIGRKLASQLLITNAKDYRSDVFSSIIALIGVGGAALGKQFDLPMLVYLDPIASLFIAFLVIRMGYQLIVSNIHSSVVPMLQHEDTDELIKSVQHIKGVIAVDDLRAREHGHYVIVDVKISVNPKISVIEGHEIARMVKYYLMKRFIHVSNVFVHVNPYEASYPYKGITPDEDSFPTVLH
jgi:cation diffusion facilitator family transporter